MMDPPRTGSDLRRLARDPATLVLAVFASLGFLCVLGPGPAFWAVGPALGFASALGIGLSGVVRVSRR